VAVRPNVIRVDRMKNGFRASRIVSIRAIAPRLGPVLRDA
jgi:hypothetical protein